LIYKISVQLVNNVYKGMEVNNSPRERRHDLNKLKILDTARTLLLTEGVKGISMRSLAERADYSPAAIYKYFDSKEAIIETLRQEAWQMLADFEIESPSNGLTTMAEQYIHAGRSYIQFASQHPAYYQLIMSTTETGPDSMEEFKKNASFIELLKFVEAGVSVGEFELPEGYTPIHLAMLSWFVVHSISLLKLTMMSKCQEEFESLSLEVMDMIKAALVKK
jgi:AcrR family transcriptional regulator